MNSYEFTLSENRCYICGSHIDPEVSRSISKFLCEICSPIKSDNFYSISNLADFLINDAKKHILANGLVNIENIDVLSFLADIGELVNTHPYYKNFPKRLSNIIVLLAKGRGGYVVKKYMYELSKMIPGYSSKIVVPMNRIQNIHNFLVETGVVEERHITDNKVMFLPTELTKNVFDSIQAISYVEREIPQRVSASIVGYVYLEGMKLTIDWLYNGVKGEPRGIFRLYGVDSKGNVYIPRSVNAPVVLMLQLIASNSTQFYSNEVLSWLHHLGYRDRTAFVRWLSRVIPNTNRFANPTMIEQGNYLFKINPNYIRMRERYRAYIRERM